MSNISLASKNSGTPIPHYSLPASDAAIVTKPVGLERALVIVALVAIWALTHRYGGVWHDGVLYAGQAIQRLSPERFVNDLFFAHGSQDNYSIFGAVYSLAIAHWGLPYASLSFMLFSQTLWLLAAASVIRRFSHGAAFWGGLLLIAVVERHYGSDKIFAYAETFVTARVFSEPLALLGLSLMLSGKSRLGSVACLVASTAFHPVIAFSAIGSALIFVLPLRVLLVAGSVGIGALAALLASDFPLSPPLGVMDPEWLAISLARNPFVHLNRWTFAELMEPLYWASLLLLAGCLGRDRIGRFWWAILASGIICFALAWVASQWPIALLIQMQTWRAGWLLKVMGIVASVSIIQALWRRGMTGRLAIALLLMSYLTLEEGGGILAMLVALAYPALPTSVTIESKLAARAKLIYAGLAISFLPTGILAIKELTDATLRIGNGFLNDFPKLSTLRADPALLLLALLGFMVIHIACSRKNTGTRYLAGGIPAIFLAVLAILSWLPSINPNSKPLALYPAPPEELKRVIRTSSSVYFDGPLGYPWFALQVGSYATHHQAAGVIFSRATALEAKRRLQRIAPLNPYESLNWKREPITAHNVSPVADMALRRACEDTALGHIILHAPVPDSSPHHVIPVRFDSRSPAVTVYVYDCSQMREVAPR
jgi:hypothetical protein